IPSEVEESRSQSKSGSRDPSTSLRMTVFMLAVSQPGRFRPVSCEKLRDYCGPFRPKARGSPPQEGRRFLRQLRRLPGFRLECRPAFALSTKASRGPEASIESVRREPAATCEPQ